MKIHKTCHIQHSLGSFQPPDPLDLALWRQAPMPYSSPIVAKLPSKKVSPFKLKTKPSKTQGKREEKETMKKTIKKTINTRIKRDNI